MFLIVGALLCIVAAQVGCRRTANSGNRSGGPRTGCPKFVSSETLFWMVDICFRPVAPGWLANGQTGRSDNGMFVIAGGTVDTGLDTRFMIVLWDPSLSIVAEGVVCSVTVDESDLTAAILNVERHAVPKDVAQEVASLGAYPPSQVAVVEVAAPKSVSASDVITLTITAPGASGASDKAHMPNMGEHWVQKGKPTDMLRRMQAGGNTEFFQRSLKSFLDDPEFHASAMLTILTDPELSPAMRLHLCDEVDRSDLEYRIVSPFMKKELERLAEEMGGRSE